MQTIQQPPMPNELLRELIRFDTTNPPGNEAACIDHIREMFEGTGIECVVVGRSPERTNLVARLPGRGEAPPFLLYGHVDVVTTAGQAWTHPPFDAVVQDGFIWGRGALDMKSGIAMFACAMLRAKAAGETFPGDVILAVLSDEEVDGTYGAKYMVEEHPGLFDGVRFAIGEGGGMTQHFAGRKFYTIMVAEKQMCSIKVTLQGPGGHGSMPIQGGAMAHLGDVLRRLDQSHLPVHITPVPRAMFQTMARNLPLPLGLALRAMLLPSLTDPLLGLLGDTGRMLSAMLHNTVSPTIVNGGHKINVIPSQVELELDGRLLPGYKPEDMLRELRTLLGEGVELEVTRFDPGPHEADMALYDTLARVLRDLDPEGIPMPLLVPGVTDARYFSRLGIQTYGYMPMDLPPGVVGTIHGADERIPVDAMEFGTRAIVEVLRRINSYKP